MIKIYGIKNCDTMKKAFRWLEEHQLAYDFHDYKKLGLSEEQAKSWLASQGWENIINKRGTTWRKLDESLRNNMNDELALEAIQSNTSMIKRPILISETGELLLGFDAERYQQALINQ